jgi:DNA-binding MarR family transcriptional regulator
VDAARLLRTQIDRALEGAGLGLTAGEARTLAYVALYPASRQTTLAAQMNVEPMTLVTFLDRLGSRSLVAREPDPTDRRAKIVQLTPDAQPTLEHVLEITRKVQEGAMRDFRPEEVEILRNLLKRMRANIAGTEPVREEK